MGEGRGIGNGGVSNSTGRTVSDQPGTFNSPLNKREENWV